MTDYVGNTFDAMPDLRNGTGENFAQIFLVSGVESVYFDKADPGMVGKVLMARKAARFFAQAVDAGAVNPANVVEHRMVAITLGAIRASVEMAFIITDADIEPAQTCGVDIAADNSYYDNVGGDADAAYVSCFNCIMAAPTAAGTALDGAAGAAASWFGGALRENESKHMGLCAIAGPGLYVTTGVTLVTSGGHHFVAPYLQISRAVLKQVWGKEYEQAPPNGMSKELFEDIACHKANHCYISKGMMDAARSTEVRDNLEQMGLGSAALRVPAKTATESKAAALLRILTSSTSILRLANVEIGDDHANAVAMLSGVPAEFAEVPAMDHAERFKLSREIRMRMSLFEDMVALFIGAHDAITDGAVDQSRGILSAHSIKAIAAEYSGAVEVGREQIRAWRKWSRTVAREGVLAGAGWGGATAPAPRASSDKVAENAGFQGASGEGKGRQ